MSKMNRARAERATKISLWAVIALSPFVMAYIFGRTYVGVIAAVVLLGVALAWLVPRKYEKDICTCLRGWPISIVILAIAAIIAGGICFTSQPRSPFRLDTQFGIFGYPFFLKRAIPSTFVNRVDYLSKFWLTNISNNPERISSYSVEVRYKWKWYELTPLQATSKSELYSCDPITRSDKCNAFLPMDMFLPIDEIGRGEKREGWVFYAWPTEVDVDPTTSKLPMRLRIYTGVGEEFTLPITHSNQPPGPGETILDWTQQGMGFRCCRDLCGTEIRTADGAKTLDKLTCNNRK